VDKKVADALFDLEKEDGRIFPADVVKAAEPKSSPLHDHFEWDNSEAGHQWRLQQARSLIARYTVAYETGPEKQVVHLRGLVALRSEGGGYRSLDSVASSPPLRVVLLEQLAKDLVSLRARYQAYEKVLQVPELFKAIDAVVAKAAEKAPAPKKKAAGKTGKTGKKKIAA
jgi:hypothetical protein